MCIQVYASVAAKLRDKSSGCTASVHDGWMGLVETCGHYGIMLHDFLLTLNRPKDPSTIITTTTKYTHCICALGCTILQLRKMVQKIE